jgi:hypothetical protein
MVLLDDNPQLASYSTKHNALREAEESRTTERQFG